MVKHAGKAGQVPAVKHYPEVLAQIRLSDGIGSIDDIVTGYKAGCVLAAALELGLFDWLEKHGPGEREKISRAVGINGMFAKSFLQSLADMGLLALAGKKYGNTALASEFLVSSGELYQGDHLLSSMGKGSKWSDLGAAITSKDPSSEVPGAGHMYVDGVLQRSLRGELQEAVKAVLAWDGAPRASTMLGVGGDHGALAVALCQALPGLRADVLESHDMARAVKNMARSRGVGDRIKVKKSDIFGDFRGSYDIVVASHLLYRYRGDLPCALYRLAGLLRPGGLFVSDHWFCSPGCEVTSGLQELDKGVSCLGHPLCGMEEFPDALEDAGLEPVGVTDAPGAYGVSKLHLAVKSDVKKASRKKGKGCGCGCD